MTSATRPPGAAVDAAKEGGGAEGFGLSVLGDGAGGKEGVGEELSWPIGDMRAEGDAEEGEVRVEGGCGEVRVWTERFTRCDGRDAEFSERLRFQEKKAEATDCWQRKQCRP